MADEKTKTEKKSNRKIKATTGAWWKSTVVEVEQESAASTETKSGDKGSEKKESKKTPAPGSRKKSSPRKATTPKKKSDDQGSPVKPKPAGRAGRSKKVQDAPPTESSTSAESAKSAIEETPLVGGDAAEAGSLSVDTPAAEVVSPPEEKKSEKRPPRKRASRAKKSTKKVEPESDLGKTSGETGEESKSEAASASPVEVSADQGKRKKPPARKPRGKRKSAPAQGETESTADDALTDESAEEITAGGIESDDKRKEPRKEAAPDARDEVEPEAEEQKEKVVLKLLINAEEPEECRLALLEDGRLESIHVSTITRAQTKNNIYKGRIVAIEPNLQAAFVEYGTDKNGFLPFSEIHPEYYKQELSEDIQKLVDAHHWKKLSITDVVERGQDVMVQVVKEEVGKKGANMTTYLSLPGRSVVLMPGSDSSGISRKITGEERRSSLRKAMNSQNIPEGIGWIVRTAGVDITKTALTRDVGYLLRLWEEIKKKAQDLEGVGQVYEDHQSVLRFLREHFDPDIEEILVDDKEALEQVKEFISLLPSKQRDVKVRLHKGSRPIFNQFSVEDQIESIYQPRVNLPSGGSIVIDPTEALVAIDVNSGSTSKGKNFDQSIYQANMEAASELARQLRLRDLGGLIVVDFIDMRNKKHIRDVEKQLKQAMKRDKAKVDFSRISKFGLMQISRQKLGAPIEAGNYRVCQHCKGRGMVRSVETLALFYLRRIQTGASRKHVKRVECHFPMDVAEYLLNKKRHEIHDHESRYKTEITIVGEPEMSPVDNEILLLKAEKETNGKKQA